VRSKSAADFKKKVAACRASATCNLEETCIGKNGFGAQQAKAQGLVEVQLNPTLTLLLQTLRDLLHESGARNLSAARAPAAAACKRSGKPRAPPLNGDIFLAVPVPVPVTRSEPGLDCSRRQRVTTTKTARPQPAVQPVPDPALAGAG